MVLEREKADIQRFTRRQKRSLRVAELADEVGVVLLELALLDVVEGLAQGVVALCKGLIGVALALSHLDQTPLGGGDTVKAVAQVLVHLVIVQALDRGDILLEREKGVVSCAHTRAEVFKAQRACRVRRGLRGLLRGGFLFVLFICQRADRQR